MTRLKICGLYRHEDTEYANIVKPDYAGFVINFPKSHRNLTPESAKVLTSQLSDDIISVGVIVNQDISVAAALLDDGIVDIVQLHGQESPEYIRELKSRTGKPVIKAFTVKNGIDFRAAASSPADYILLDSGMGSGETFDWNLSEKISRPFFLAGGLNSGNLISALDAFSPFAVDISSGVETDRVKDLNKMQTVKCLLNNYNKKTGE